MKLVRLTFYIAYFTQKNSFIYIFFNVYSLKYFSDQVNCIRNMKLDIIIVLDSSSSVGLRNWKKKKFFLWKLVK